LFRDIADFRLRRPRADGTYINTANPIFLVARGIRITAGRRQEHLSTEAIAAEGMKSTVFVQCASE
jgi:hypothetical protein